MRHQDWSIARGWELSPPTVSLPDACWHWVAAAAYCQDWDSCEPDTGRLFPGCCRQQRRIHDKGAVLPAAGSTSSLANLCGRTSAAFSSLGRPRLQLTGLFCKRWLSSDRSLHQCLSRDKQTHSQCITVALLIQGIPRQSTTWKVHGYDCLQTSAFYRMSRLKWDLRDVGWHGQYQLSAVSFQ